MRTLTVRQPWAWAIIHGGKDVENRVRNIAGDYRGPVAIHAGKAFDDSAWDVGPMGDLMSQLLAEDTEAEFTPGAIIGVVDLSDVHPCANHHFHPICHDQTRPEGLREAAARGDGACSPWADGPWHLVLANPRPLAEPIPFKGALSLRTLDDDTTARVLAALTPTETNRTPS